ncbi:MAG: hypothetical protein ABSG80_14325 [Verrucomicrobiota bacterium]|jgi:hypothetical protein
MHFQIVVVTMMFGLQSWTFARTNDTASASVSIPKPLAALAQSVAPTDRIIVTNWAGTGFGESPFTVTVATNDVKKVVRAISLAKFVGGQEHPNWEWGWKLLFYQGTNLLAAVCFNGGSFLTDGVWNDESGVLGTICANASNREYLARVYGDEDKDFNESKKAEAREWLKSPLHTILGEDKKKVLKFVNDFYAAGAKKVYVADIEMHLNGKNPPKENAKYLLVVLPQDKETRRKFFVVHWKAVKAWGFDADDDVGQKYTWYPIDWHDIK